MIPIRSNWAEHIIAARKMLERIATLAEDRRFDEAIQACGDLQQLAGEARSAIWYADRELVKNSSIGLLPVPRTMRDVGAAVGAVLHGGES